MNNVENTWLWEEQKKLIADVFTACWRPRIIPWICTENLQQLPPSDGPKWLSREQSTAHHSDEPGARSTVSRTQRLLTLQPRPEPACSMAGTHLAIIHCPAYHTTVIISLLKFHWEIAEAQSIYWYFPATGKLECHWCIMGRAFYALLWPSS